MRTAALGVVGRVLATSDARLLAAAIMPTHLHLVVQQGHEPISRLMQQLLRRLALLLQRDRNMVGPVFWRPYACQPCMDPSHARNAIVYTHLNPVRARMCPEPEAYPWTSHSVYVGPDPVTGAGSAPMGDLSAVIDPGHALPLFATGPGRRVEELHDDYRRYVDWRLAVDRLRHAEDEDATAGPAAAADVPWDPAWARPHWGKGLSPLFHGRARATRGPSTGPPTAYVPDMSDIARSVLGRWAPELTLDAVKGRGGSSLHVKARHAMIRAMAAAGHPNVDIARFLRLSESAVSKVRRMRLPIMI